MNIYGKVENGVCTVVTEADASWRGLEEATWIMSEPDNVAWVGATVVDGVFEKLPSPPEQPLP